MISDRMAARLPLSRKTLDSGLDEPVPPARRAAREEAEQEKAT